MTVEYIKTEKNIKDLNVTLDKLYNNDYQINVHLSDKAYTFYIILKDVRDKIDCKLSSIGANLWTRTNKGVNFEKYKRIGDLQTAIKKEIKNKVNTNGEITFSLSDVICYM